MRALPLILILLGVLATEAIARWWTHPSPAGAADPVLVWRPETTATTASRTDLHDIVARALPALRCSTGTAARLVQTDGTVIHVAFFAWDTTTAAAHVLEAFRHLPDECLGSIGHQLVARHPPRAFQLDGQSLGFDHTVFRDAAGAPIHAFKAVWVSGGNTITSGDFRGGGDQWRRIRWYAALHRFRPARTRVIQGAVHGIPDPDSAWQAFKDAVLQDLRFE